MHSACIYPVCLCTSGLWPSFRLGLCYLAIDYYFIYTFTAAVGASLSVVSLVDRCSLHVLVRQQLYETVQMFTILNEFREDHPEVLVCEITGNYSNASNNILDLLQRLITNLF